MSGTVAVESVLPHAAPMILIHEMVRNGETSAESSVCITEDVMFYDAETGGVPSYVGIEYIAQTVAAHAGAAARANGDPVRIGFLLGTRHYACSVPYFVLGAKLTVRVRALYEAPHVSKFQGTISLNGGPELASCAISVYLRDGTEGGP